MNTTTTSRIDERANAESDVISGKAKPSLISIDKELRARNRALDTDALLDLLSTAHRDLYHRAEVVGHWVWITFDVPQPRPVTARLAQLGFHWNNVRQTWQHPCGRETRIPCKGDPREKYGSGFPGGFAPRFNESDCGGVFDGFTVTSDADPGL